MPSDTPKTPAEELAATAKALAEVRQQVEELLQKMRQVREMQSKGLPFRNYSATIQSRMEAEIGSKTPGRRRGPPLRSTGPLAAAAVNSGLSMRDVAKAIGENYDTAKTWNRRAWAPDHVRSKLAAPPYSVPNDAWKP